LDCFVQFGILIDPVLQRFFRTRCWWRKPHHSAPRQY
jgi:hypothetical protein